MNGIDERLAALNPHQREAVTAPDGPLLVTAGAGSGKTAVLVNRVAWLIGVKSVPADRIIAVTFTNKAAREMKRRVQEILQGEEVNPVIGTFHGLCNQFLRTRHQAAGLDRYFNIMDQDDQKSFISNLMKEHNLRSTELPPSRFQSYINKCKESKKRAGVSEVYSGHSELLEHMYEIYERECEEQGQVDFAELILRTVEVMEHNAEVREQIQQRILHVLIDEFQDTNELQYQWMEIFGGWRRNISAVGDEDQSIYSWRGALSGNLKRFERQYDDALVVRLEQNYRSTKPILDAANALIRQNTNRFEKKLWTGNSGGSRIKYMSARDSNEEAEFIVDQIRAFSDTGRSLSEFAVLYRTNAQSRNFEEAFGAEGIPFRVYGGVRFYQRKEVKDILSYLRLAANPDANDASLVRAINSPPRGIGEVAKRSIAEMAADREISYWEAACALADAGRRWAKVRPFIELINELQSLNATRSLSELMELTIELSDLREYYEQHPDPTEQNRVVNLEELINAAAGFEQSQESTNSADILDRYLDSVVLDPGDTHDDNPEEKVQMMTLHTAKGLEFPIVFLTGLDDTILPHFHSIGSWKSSTFRKSMEQEQMQEERRLCYVGMTRAKEILYFTRANRRMLRGQWENFHQSRFVQEVPRDLIELVNSTELPEPTVIHDANCVDWLGKSVSHRKFGEGVVTDVEANVGILYLTIDFETVGTKVILSEFVRIDS